MRCEPRPHSVRRASFRATLCRPSHAASLKSAPPRGAGALAADSGPLVGVECLFVNEWYVPQTRVLLISPRASYRVAFKKGQPQRFKRLPHEQLSKIVKCASPLNKMNTVTESGVQALPAVIQHSVRRLAAHSTTRSPDCLCGRADLHLDASG